MDNTNSDKKIDFDRKKCIDPYLRCAFYGACQTAFGFEHACVIAHSPQGCQLSANVAFRWQQADYTVTEVLCSKLCEDEIVHGGEDTLRRTILDAKSYDVPVVFVVSACGPEIVGDNIQAVAEEMESEVDFEIIPVSAPGFLGSQYKGIDIALETLISRYADTTQERKENTVCLIAPHASGNPTWPGDVNWIKNILKVAGVTVLSVLSHQSSLKDLQNLMSCESCIVLSHDAGMKAAQVLSEHGIEWLCQDIPLPIGIENTQRFLTVIGERYDCITSIEDIIKNGEETVIKNLRGRGLAVEFFNQVSTGLVTDNTIGIPLLRFLTEDLEMIPDVVLFRSENSLKLAKKEMETLPIDPVFQCGVEVYQVKHYLQESDVTCVVGSNIERHIAFELNIPISFEVVTPVLQYRMTDKQYFGYTGILHLIEILQNAWWDRWKSKKKRYKSKW